MAASKELVDDKLIDAIQTFVKSKVAKTAQVVARKSVVPGDSTELVTVVVRRK